MSIIYKYPFNEAAFILIPPGKVTLVAQQFSHHTLPTVWIEHELPISEDRQKCIVVGTGHELNLQGWEHIGSCVCDRFVWHVYREGKL